MNTLLRVVERPPRRVVLVVVSVLLFGWVFLYRFNTLGGSLGGFDNDHFLYYVTARQVQAGEQPVRDFFDAVHGARPSLTYELSAAAQRYLGSNLRSEAWLTVGGVALGAALAFIAGSMVAPWPWALATALLSALLSPKLYGYPKVLVTAVVPLLIVAGRGRLTRRRVAVMSLWTAAAFLFRHDYAVYCAAGFVTLMALEPGARWRARAARVVAYVGVTAVLLAPSLWWIEHYRGLVEYVRNGQEMSREEYARTQIGWPRFVLDAASPSALIDREENAEAWIYYVFLGLPIVGMGMAAWKSRRASEAGLAPAALAALSVTTLVTWHYVLRGNLEARFGDMAPVAAVLGAYLLASAARGNRTWPRIAASGVPAIAVFAVTVACIWSLSSVIRELGTAHLLEPQVVFARTHQVSRQLAALPRALRESQAADRMQAADYLYRCTRPTDRVIAVGYYPEVAAFAERLFAGGRVTFVVGNYADERYMRETIAKIESQSVPIVLGGQEVDYSEFRLLGDYLHARYDEAGVVSSLGATLRVFARRGLERTIPGPNGLPCFG